MDRIFINYGYKFGNLCLIGVGYKWNKDLRLETFFKSQSFLFAEIIWRRRNLKTWERQSKTAVMRLFAPSGRELLARSCFLAKVIHSRFRISRSTIRHQGHRQGPDKEETLPSEVYRAGNRYHEKTKPQEHCQTRGFHRYPRLHPHCPRLLWSRQPTNLPGSSPRKNLPHRTGSQSPCRSSQGIEMYSWKELHPQRYQIRKYSIKERRRRRSDLQNRGFRIRPIYWRSGSQDSLWNLKIHGSLNSEQLLLRYFGGYLGTWSPVLLHAVRLVSFQRYFNLYKGHDMKAEINRRCTPSFSLNSTVSKKEKLKDLPA